MRKTTWLFLIVVVLLIVAVVYFAYSPFKDAMNSNVLAPLSTMFGGLATGVFASPWWQTYFAPPVNAFLIGMAVMLVFAVVAVKWAWPTVKKVKVPTVQKPGGAYQSQPTAQPIIIQQPAPAVQAPQQVAAPAPAPKEEKVEETA